MRVAFELVSNTPILFHNDDVEASDMLTSWRTDTMNANLSVRGDDRTPPWTWITYLYTDGTNVVLPWANLMVCLRQAGARKIIQNKKTFKEVTQSGIIYSEEFLQFFCNGKPVPLAPIMKVRDQSFSQHLDVAKSLGFRLYVKRARIGQGKHIRVRPRFENWSAKGELEVAPAAKELTYGVLEEIFGLAGKCGLGDWRPTSPKSPGPFGMFTAKLKKL